MASEEYTKEAVNAVNRLAKRGAYDYATIHTLFNTSPILHVSFIDPTHPFPIILPMIGCTGSFSSPSSDPNASPQDIYIHGYVSSRLFKTPTTSATEEGLPITVSATFLDGLVLSLTPFHNSCNYRSAVAYGYASLVTDSDERMYAMQKITNNILPSRWENSRVPPTRAEISSTSILRIKIHSASAKVRTGGPSEDRADLKNKELVKGTWTGVVPVWYQWGEPMPGKENEMENVQGYIEDWRVKESQLGRVKAYEAIEEEGK
ncbi:5-nitroimidazole antibiotic resistance protein [Lindgomyces ingoldianus]|uniref:5-nitroimidazole antibiotic resistance protein n=1 Tax=Lindgomyces ingoldianus TaxID=673940 RepID=A0ACB6Q8Q6_9PLEO|nr:5-nitroimidazole antibiotic resistance protein [Lindgomyces ingoldianus]KAF2463271.1 5-nitroimidazole antibiotic resistance protein [Lindgomyces ingoldianus]